MLLITQLCLTDFHVFYLRNAWNVRHGWVITWSDYNDGRFVTGLSMWLSYMVSRFLSSGGNESLHVGWMMQTAETSETHSRMNLATIFKFQAVKNYCITVRTKFLILGDFFLYDLFQRISLQTCQCIRPDTHLDTVIRILAGSFCTMIFLWRATHCRQRSLWRQFV